jgi:hypothetical protein
MIYIFISKAARMCFYARFSLFQTSYSAPVGFTVLGFLVILRFSFTGCESANGDSIKHILSVSWFLLI